MNVVEMTSLPLVLLWRRTASCCWPLQRYQLINCL